MSDYISRETLIGKVEKHYCAPCKETGGDLGGDWCRSCVINSVLEKVRGIPAADVEPVRHGKWNIRVSDERTLCLECSVCGRKVDNFNLHRLLIFGEYGEACRRYPYCHCGSKMDLEDDNNENFSR